MRQNYQFTDRLAGGRYVYFRGIKPADRDALRDDLFANMGSESLRNRFFVTKNYLSDEELRFLTEVDFSRHFALVAEIEIDGQRHLVGTGRFVRDASAPEQAELAFAVADAYQGQGIGNLLMRHLVDCARELGLTRLEGTMLAQNQPMARLIRKSGAVSASASSKGLTTLTLAL